MPSMDAWFDETVDSSLRAGTVAAARVVPKHKANSPSTCLSPSACRQLMHVQADVKAGDARGSLASSRSILNEGARGGRGRGRGKGQWGGGRGKGRGKGRGRLDRPGTHTHACVLLSFQMSWHSLRLHCWHQWHCWQCASELQPALS